MVECRSQAKRASLLRSASFGARRVQIPPLPPISRREKMKRIIEVKGAEGGKDAKLFAEDLAQAYVSLAQRMS